MPNPEQDTCWQQRPDALQHIRHLSKGGNRYFPWEKIPILREGVGFYPGDFKEESRTDAIDGYFGAIGGGNVLYCKAAKT